jgi:hypothetical protein
VVSKTFLYAGRASFVVENSTGESVTVKVTKSKKANLDRNGNPYPPCYYVNIRYQNEEWTYVGVLKDGGRILVTPKAKLLAEDRRVKIAQWGLILINQQKLVPAGYRLEHTGRCGRCGKMLRDAESIAIGLGPDCEQMV